MTQAPMYNPFGQPATPMPNPHVAPAVAPSPFGQPAAPPPTPFSAAPPPTPFGAPAPGDDPFGAPAPSNFNRAPRMLDLWDPINQRGRLLLLAPIKTEQITKYKMVSGVRTEQVATRVTMDMVVLDGGLLRWGGREEDPRASIPHNQQGNPPILFENVWNENVAIINATSRALYNRQTGQGMWMVLGRLYLGEAKNGNNAPWLIGRPDLPKDRQDEGATEEEKQLARAFLASEAAVPMLSKPRGPARA